MSQNLLRINIKTNNHITKVIQSSQSRKQKQQELIKQNQKLNQLNKKINDFFDMIGDLKDKPLNLSEFQDDLARYNFGGIMTVRDIKSLFDITIQRMRYNNRQKTNWGLQSLILLFWLVAKYSQFYEKNTLDFIQSDWEAISSLIPGKTGQQTKFKWLGLKYNHCKRKKEWQPWEDEYLQATLRDRRNKDWYEISKQLFRQPQNTDQIYRIPKQCRQRWACHLNPIIKKGHWSKEQDYVLFSNFIQIGKKWAKIAKLIKSRTQNAIKNRFTLVVSKYKSYPRGTFLNLEQFLKNYLLELKNEDPKQLSNNICEMDPLELPQFPTSPMVMDKNKLPRQFNVEQLKEFNYYNENRYEYFNNWEQAGEKRDNNQEIFMKHGEKEENDPIFFEFWEEYQSVQSIFNRNQDQNSLMD